MNTLRQILTFQRDVLFFRRPAVDPNQIFWPMFGYIVLVSWVVGLGRYWDHPSAHAWQYLGLGSVIYIFVLSLLLFVMVWPLRPLTWSYKNVFVFVGMTSLPAVLYAIPVERFMELKTAQTVNGLFLAVIALWRVAIFMWFLNKIARLNDWRTIIGTLMPLTLIVFALTFLNLEHAVFNIMEGVRESNQTPYDGAYHTVLLLSVASLVSFPLLLIFYVCAIFRRKVPATR